MKNKKDFALIHDDIRCADKHKPYSEDTPNTKTYKSFIDDIHCVDDCWDYFLRFNNCEYAYDTISNEYSCEVAYL